MPKGYQRHGYHHPPVPPTLNIPSTQNMSSTIPPLRELLRRPNLWCLRVGVVACVLFSLSTVFINPVKQETATREEPKPPWFLSTDTRWEDESVNMRISRNKSIISSCHFEDATGYYFNEKDATNNTLWTWNWIHNMSLSSASPQRRRPRRRRRQQHQRRSPCIITNHLQAIRKKRYRPTHPLVFVTLGDSLDRNIVMDYICSQWKSFSSLVFISLTLQSTVSRSSNGERTSA